MRDLKPAELRAYLETSPQPPLLLDVREPWEFDICHLEGSRLIPMVQLFGSADELLDPGRETVIICHHGIRSRQAGRFLAGRGFDKLINLNGGLEAWARDLDPHMGTY